MQIQVYPFLVSRNRTLDYRTVVAPRFMCNNGVAHELARAAGGGLTPPGYAVCREIQVTSSEDLIPKNLILVFHVIESNQQEIYSDASDEIMTDPFGREILWIEGFILRKKTNLLNLTIETFETVHEQLLSSYRLFWESTDLFEVAVIPSEVIDLDIAADNLKKIVCKEISPFPDWSDIGMC